MEYFLAGATCKSLPRNRWRGNRIRGESFPIKLLMTLSITGKPRSVLSLDSTFSIKVLGVPCDWVSFSRFPFHFDKVCQKSSRTSVLKGFLSSPRVHFENLDGRGSHKNPFVTPVQEVYDKFPPTQKKRKDSSLCPSSALLLLPGNIFFKKLHMQIKPKKKGLWYILFDPHHN